MTITDYKLKVKLGSNTETIHLYTDPANDFYTQQGFPVTMKNGTTYYAPIVRADDIYLSKLRGTMADGTDFYIGTTGIPKTQSKYVSSYFSKRFGGSGTYYYPYSSVSFYVPYKTTIYISSKVDMYHQAWGVSDDGWQRAMFDLYLDNSGGYAYSSEAFARIDVRTSYGSRRWRQVCTNYSTTLDKGWHYIYSNVLCQGSSCDSHATEVYNWSTTITLA